MADAVPATPTPEPSTLRRWSVPTLRELPKLTALTLASAIGGGGGTGGGGSTVFGFLAASFLAASALSGCFADRGLGPVDGTFPRAIATVTCSADVTTQKVQCSGPVGAAGPEIFGGQGSLVALTSFNASYSTVDSNFTFFAVLQNLTAQTLGWDGSDPTGVRIFFQDPPVATVGTGAITIEDDSIGTFTAPGQSYYVMTTGLIQPHLAAGPVQWTFKVDPGVTHFAFAVLVAADVPDVGGILRWRAVTSQTAYRMAGVAFTADNDMIAVGAGGMALRWNGTKWNPMTPATTADLIAVAPIGDGNYIAVGAEGRIFRTNGILWAQLYQHPAGDSLLALWVQDSTHFIAVGVHGATVVRNGASYTDANNGGGEITLMSVTATGDFSQFIALADGNHLYASPGTASMIEVDWKDGLAGGVLLDGNDQLLWSYFDYGISAGLIVRNGDTLFADYSGNTWPRKMIRLPGDRVAFSEMEFSTAWSYLASLDLSSDPVVVAGISDALGPEIRDFTMAKGDASQFITTEPYNNEDIFRWTGSTWEGSDQPFLCCGSVDLWGIGDTAWVVDGSGKIGKIVNGVVTPLPNLSGSKKIWGLSSTELYVADDTALWVGNGTDPWTFEALIVPGGTIQDLWGDPASGTLIVSAQLGPQGVYRIRVGGLWSGGFTPTLLQGVWGCSGTEAWIGSTNGFLWRFDGTTLSPDIDYLTAGFPPDDQTAITGSSCTDVWITGHNRTSHWNGFTWSNVMFGVNVPVAAMREPGRAYLLSGMALNDYLVDSTGLQTQQLPVPTQQRMVQAAWQLDNGELLVAGARYILRGMR